MIHCEDDVVMKIHCEEDDDWYLMMNGFDFNSLLTNYVMYYFISLIS